MYSDPYVFTICGLVVDDSSILYWKRYKQFSWHQFYDYAAIKGKSKTERRHTKTGIKILVAPMPKEGFAVTSPSKPSLV